MHKYEACPSQTHEPDPEGQTQILKNVRTEEGLTISFEDTSSEITSLRSSSRPHGSHSPISPPVTSQDESPQTLNKPINLVVSGSEKHKLAQPLLVGYSNWQTAWRIQTVVLGLYVTSLGLAVAHSLFFQYLDGRIISPDTDLPLAKTTTIPQGYVTTISLLLTTAFRAALVASVGVCYTQHLWATLRTRVLKVGLIEDLFQIQTNAFHIASSQIYLKTPILAAIAIFCWVVPIATVYPPGALIVELRDLSINTTFNVSVFHAKDFMYDTNPLALSEIWCNYNTGYNTLGPLRSYPKQAGNVSFLKTCKSRWGDIDDVRYVTRSSLMSGELASMSPPRGDNTSYALQFWGTTLDCEDSSRTVERTITNADVKIQNRTQDPSPETAWIVSNFTSMCHLWSNQDQRSSMENLALTFQVTEWPKEYRYYPCLQTIEKVSANDQAHGRINLPSSGIQILFNVTETVCRPRLTMYSINVSFTGGQQHVSSQLEDKRPIPAYNSAFEHFNGSYEQWVHFSDAFSVYYDFAANLNRSWLVDGAVVFTYADSSAGSSLYTASNGSTFNTCLLNTSKRISAGGSGRPDYHSQYLEVWPLSVFERRGLRPTPNYRGQSNCPQFNAQIAKELLVNTTISALALNKRFDLVQGTVTRAFNIYHFRNRLAFFLPYSLSIGLAIPIIALGLASFYTHNQGTSAITGGFLQLLLTTTGRTSLEKLIKGSGTTGGHENVSEELKAAEIRFGELIELDEDAPEISFAPERCSGTSTEQRNTSSTMLRCNTQQNGGTEVVLAMRVVGKNESQVERAGFGLAQEVKLLRRKNV